MNKDDGFSKAGGWGAVWGKGYTGDKEGSGVYTNLGAAGS